MTTRTRKKRTLGAAAQLDKLLGPLTLGKVLRSTREGDGQTLGEFARRLGISKSHLSDIELGRKAVSAARAAGFTRRLGYLEAQYVALALQDELTRGGLRHKVAVTAA